MAVAPEKSRDKAAPAENCQGERKQILKKKEEEEDNIKTQSVIKNSPAHQLSKECSVFTKQQLPLAAFLFKQMG